MTMFKKLTLDILELRQSALPVYISFFIRALVDVDSATSKFCFVKIENEMGPAQINYQQTVCYLQAHFP